MRNTWGIEIRTVIGLKTKDRSGDSKTNFVNGLFNRIKFS